MAIIAPLYTSYGLKVSSEDRRRWQRNRFYQIDQAIERAMACYLKGDKKESFFWYGRAERLSNDKSNVMLSYAMVALEIGYYDIAQSRFSFLHKHFNLREAAFGSVWCLYRQGSYKDAAQKLGKALSQYAAPEGSSETLNILARYAGYLGWATLSNSGVVHIQASGSVSLSLDNCYLGETTSGDIDLLQWTKEKSSILWSHYSYLKATVEGKPILGSPFDIRALTQCDSLVEVDKNCVKGWIWYPAEPDFIPSIWINDNRKAIKVTKTLEESGHERPLYRPKKFKLPFSTFKKEKGNNIVISDVHKRPLLGSPLNLQIERILSGKRLLPSFSKPPFFNKTALEQHEKICLDNAQCVVIIPVYKHYYTTLLCLMSVLKTVPLGTAIVVINDATPEKKLQYYLIDIARQGRIILRTNDKNRGFSYSVNQGLSLCQGRDAIILNSDTVVFSGWVKRLREWIGQPNVGTATPLSNEGGLTSYPLVGESNKLPTLREAQNLDLLCQDLDKSSSIDLPTGNGFCMAISAECLQKTGLMRDQLFAQGYGEENDFCLRASMLGFKHVAAVNVYVRHQQGVSFQEGTRGLLKRNLKILNALYPHYAKMVHAFEERNPLHITRRCLDWARLLHHSRHFDHAVLMIQHQMGGGVARAVRERGESYQKKGILALTLTPNEKGCALSSSNQSDLIVNLNYYLSSEFNLLCFHLKKLKVPLIEWHHLSGHAPEIRTLHHSLCIPYDVFIHDHVWFCPRISLMSGDTRYCGEPSSTACQACIDKWGVYFGEEETVVPILLQRSYNELNDARRVIAPSADTAKRLVRHIEVHNRIIVEPLENDSLILQSEPVTQYNHSVRRIGVLGGISRWKGYNVLLSLGRYIQSNQLPLEIILIGCTADDDALMDAGIRVMGPYKEEDVLSLIDIEEIDIGFIPSIAPETWCYTLGWLWRSGVDVLSFDIGASGERIQKSQRGQVIPLGASVDFLAHYLLKYKKY